MDLQPFDPVHTELVASWPRSAEELLMWCGTSQFPLPAATIEGWHQDPEVRARLLIEDDVPIGYGQLWLDAEEDEVELARIILAPAARGQGLGRKLVRALLAEAVATGRADIFLRVHPDNSAALRCYRGAGFVPVDAALAAQWNVPQPVAYRWLRPA
jgi:ribosomal protein S18 acetylase RimI-like enzyme